MKLIDVRTLKEWVENWFTKNRFYHPYVKNNNIPITELYDILEQIPPADVVKVVRCKDCRYFNNTFPFLHMCNISGMKMEPDDYCSLYNLILSRKEEQK